LRAVAGGKVFQWWRRRFRGGLRGGEGVRGRRRLIWGFEGRRRWGRRFDGGAGDVRGGLRAVVGGEGVSMAAPGMFVVV